MMTISHVQPHLEREGADGQLDGLRLGRGLVALEEHLTGLEHRRHVVLPLLSQERTCHHLQV